MASGFVLGLLLCLPLAQGCAWEWAGMFDLSAGNYTWSCTKQESTAATAKLLVYPLTDATAASYFAIESDAETVWNTTTSASASALLEAGSAYTLTFDNDTETTQFTIHIETAQAYAVIFEYSIYEFCYVPSPHYPYGVHYLRSEAEDPDFDEWPSVYDVDPVHEEFSHHGDEAGTEGCTSDESSGVHGLRRMFPPSVAAVLCIACAALHSLSVLAL